MSVQMRRDLEREAEEERKVFRLTVRGQSGVQGHGLDEAPPGGAALWFELPAAP